MVTHRDVCPVHCVDKVKISPHEPVATVYGIEAALKNTAPGIKLAAGFEAIVLKCLRGHAARLKRNAVVTVAVIEPPIFIKQTPFILQAPIERRARKRREMIESGDVKGVVFRKFNRVAKTFGRVAVVTENERAIDANAMPTQIRQRFLKSAAHGVERFVHIFEIRRVQAFKANEHALTAAENEQFKKIFVMGGVDGRLTDPADTGGNQSAEKFFRLL